MTKTNSRSDAPELAAAGAHAGSMTAEQVELVKRTIAKGATDDELRSILRSCRRNGTGRTAAWIIPESALRRLYVELGLSTGEIGTLIGCSKKAARMALIRAGIERRPLREAFAASDTHGPKSGHLAPGWKGGRRRHTGYVQRYMPEHPDAGSGGYVFEHRLVAERMLGRRLRAGEEVHHINQRRDDNRPENLRVMTRSEHRRLHANARWEANRGD